MTRLVRNDPENVSHIPEALDYLVTSHSVEADAPEVCSGYWWHLCIRNVHCITEIKYTLFLVCITVNQRACEKVHICIF